MGIHRLPRVRNYWSKDSLLGVPAVQESMSLSRFWAIWRNHLVDNSTVDCQGLSSSKIQPLLNVLSDTFLKQYSPGQELSVDKSMVKYKGHCSVHAKETHQSRIQNLVLLVCMLWIPMYISGV